MDNTIDTLNSDADSGSDMWHTAIGGFTVCNGTELAQLLPMCALELSADVHTVDLRTASDAAQAMAILSKRLQFPEYFGQNLDALYDMTGECADVLQGRLDIQITAVPHIWLIRSTPAQAAALQGVLEAMRDAMGEFKGTALSVLWAVL